MSIKLRYRGDWRVDVRKDFILDPALTIGAKVIYIALKAHCAPGQDTAFPSSAYLAKHLSVSRETVQKYVAELREAGLVETEQRGEAGKFTHTFYTVNDTDSRSGKNPLREKPVTGNSDTKTPQGKEEPTVKTEVPPAASFAKVFVEGWSAAYEADRGVKYVFGGAKDGTAVKRLAAIGLSSDELLAMARRAWKQRGKAFFYCEKVVTIATFAAFFNQVRAELSARPTGPVGARVATAAQLAADAKTDF